jgi:hypothetical protein
MKSFNKKQIILWLLLVICMTGTPLFADDDTDQNTDADSYSLVQVMLGTARYSNLNLNYQSTTDPNLEATSTFTWMPLIGIEGGVPIIKKPVSFGIEGGALFSWMTDTVSAVGTVPGQITLHVDNQLYLLDLSIGPYVSAEVGKRIRVYGGLGPILMFGQNNNQSNEYVTTSQTVYDSNTSSAFGPGIYGRAGVEFRLKNSSWMGIGARAFGSKLNFGNVSGTTDVNGFQLMITYTVGVKSDDDGF